ncbi:hypothetical protein CUJ83_10150 [Methanocella sp. CWC-04]|uniref:Uncharacterized protein n=1 Tax=Methanooceanicella nereidis TaxID=2052831 RepID=A0AAP2RFW8_9EURY|nr:hypothetical protein [Methanocella sp. CWC-04]
MTSMASSRSNRFMSNPVCSVVVGSGVGVGVASGVGSGVGVGTTVGSGVGTIVGSGVGVPYTSQT